MADNKKLNKCKCNTTAQNTMKQVEEESFAMTLLKECSKMSKRWFVGFVIVVCLWVATIGGFIWYLNQYDFSSYSITAENGGNANYINNGGEILNGND